VRSRSGRSRNERASLLATGVVGDRELAAVGESDVAAVEQAGESLLHDRDQLDERAQAPVVLRLVGKVREPAGQHPADQAEEPAVRADPDHGLGHRKRDQLSVADQRRPAAARRDRMLVREHIRCDNKGFQIRHLELQSRGDTGLEAFFIAKRVPANPTDFHITPLAVGPEQVGSAGRGLVAEC